LTVCGLMVSCKHFPTTNAVKYLLTHLSVLWNMLSTTWHFIHELLT